MRVLLGTPVTDRMLPWRVDVTITHRTMSRRRGSKNVVLINVVGLDGQLCSVLCTADRGALGCTHSPVVNRGYVYAGNLQSWSINEPCFTAVASVVRID